MTTVTDQEYLRLCEPCFIPSDGAWLYGTVDGATDACVRCGAPAGVYVVHPHAQEPNLMNAHMPADASTCVALAHYAEIVWDTNRYYADLGVDPRATKREIREALVEHRANGRDSERLTFIVKQLLNDDIRRLYDATPLGSLFYDYEVETAERIAKAAAIAEYRRLGMELPEWLARELNEDEAEEPPETVLDTEDDEVETLLSHPSRNVWGWRWAYYVWRSRQDDLWRLARWQEHLISALAQRGERLRIAVGFLGGDLTQPWEVVPVGYRVVVFLHENESPTEELAHKAASRVVEVHQATGL
jgi:hypothetical protein